MIKQSSIDEVRDKAALTDVVGIYTTVKRNSACCPLHIEKTPSFHLYQAKQMYKCFGCGESGDAIKLVMKMENKTFIEAIEYLANRYNITLDYENNKPTAEAQERKDLRTLAHQTTEWAHTAYRKCIDELPDDAAPIQYLQSRGYSRQRIESWDIGYAPQSWDFLKTPIINKGWYNPAVECGLVYSSDGKSYDFFRNRIIIPIHDVNGMIVGFAGRMIPGDDKELNLKIPKWVNPKESVLYSKKKVWYGLWQAQKAIRTEGCVYLVEGYNDVQSMHDAGIVNTISACGTEVDDEQVKFLKRYTSHVVLGFDGDKAGVKKQLKLMDLFLTNGFKVETLELPDQQDPDEFIRSLNYNFENPQIIAA